MNWHKKKKDVYRWHLHFAWLPIKIHDRWFWLECYAWRKLKEDEAPKRTKPNPINGIYVWESWEEWTTKSGFAAWKKLDGLCLPFASIGVSWHEPRPRLKVVPETQEEG